MDSMGDGDLPVLILVGGPPASGKTTLAGWLASAFRLPLLSRDELKESLMGSLGSPDRARSRQLGGASYELLLVAANGFVAAGVGAVVESNFSAGIAEADWRPIVARSRALQIYCRASHDELRWRFLDRALSGQRHPGHHDLSAASLADFEAGLASSRYRPLELLVPALCVDTTTGYAPELQAIHSFVSSVVDARFRPTLRS
jgi:predicted kinase